MQLYVKTLTGTVISLEVNQFDTILSIKEQIYKLEGFPINQQNLIFKSAHLQNDKKVSDYDLYEESNIHLLIKLPDNQEEEVVFNEPINEPINQQTNQQSNGQNNGTISIVVVDGQKSSTTIQMNLHDSVKQLKNEIKRSQGKDINTGITVSYQGKTMSEMHSLNHYEIKDSATIHMTQKVNGGIIL